MVIFFIEILKKFLFVFLFFFLVFFCYSSKVSRPSIISGMRFNKQNDTDTSGIWFSGFWVFPAVGLSAVFLG